MISLQTQITKEKETKKKQLFCFIKLNFSFDETKPNLRLPKSRFSLFTVIIN